MADEKITGLPPIPFVSGVDLIAVVDDPSGTPLTTKSTIDQLATFLASNTITLLNKTLTTPTIIATGFVNMQHTHLAANTGGTITAAAISDFATAVAATTSVTANTAKVTNATHTGEVTGSIALTITNDAVTTAKILNDAVTYAKIQNVVADNVFLGNNSGVGGIVDELTGTEATAMLNVFTTSLQGLVPASGGSATEFLSADGTFKVPAGGGDMVLADVQTVTGAKTFEDGTLLLRNVADTISSQFTNINTVARTYTLPDVTDTLVVLGLAQTFTASQTFGVATNNFQNESTIPTQVFIKHANNNGAGTNLLMQSTRGTLASPTATQGGDGLGEITFIGYGPSLGTGAQILVSATENWTSGNNGTQFLIRTVDDGSSSLVTRLAISNSTFNFQNNTLTNILDITTITNLNGIAIGNYATTTNILTMSNKTLTNPIIASFVNAVHDHSTAAGGGTIAIADTSGTLAIARGGSGEVTQQAAINALTNVAAATNEFVLTKDTGTGDAIWKVAPGAGGGITSLNGLTAATQTFAVGQADELTISSVTSTHTFSIGVNIPRLDEANTFTANQLIQVDGTAAALNINSFNILGGNNVTFTRGRGSVASPVALQDNDNIADINFRGHDGTNPVNSAFIRVQVDGAVSSGIVDGEFQFWLENAGTPANRLTLFKTGELKLEGQLNMNSNTILNTGTLTLPTITDVLVGRTTTDTLTNKTLTSPILTTPTIASFVNATHNHQSAAAGGILVAAAISDYASATASWTNKTMDESASGNTIKIRRAVQMVIVNFDTFLLTGNGKFFFHIDQSLAGNNLIDVHAEVITAGSSGTTDIQVHNVTQAVDMLSTVITIDAGETGSDTAAIPAVIDTANDDVAINDLIRIDIDAVSTTSPLGLIVTLGFREP